MSKEFRRLDRLHRIAIPKQFYDKLELYVGQPMEITVEYGNICMKPFDYTDINSKPYVGIVRRIDEVHRVTIPAEYLNVTQFLTGIKYPIIELYNTIRLCKE